MHQQVRLPQHDSVDEPLESLTDEIKSAPPEVASDEEQLTSTESCGITSAAAAVDAGPAEDEQEDALGEERACASAEKEKLESMEMCEPEVDSDPEECPPECLKAIKNLGLIPGSLRAVVLQGARGRSAEPAVVRPDPEESCTDPDEEVMVSCTPRMIGLLTDDSDRAAQLARNGVSLVEVLKRIRTDARVAVDLSKEMEVATIKGRRRLSSGSSQASAAGVEKIRRNYKERQYQRMISGEVGGCINALKTRTDDCHRDQLLIELRQSLSLGVSALLVFVASYLVGFYIAKFVVGVKSFHTRVLCGACTAAAGGLLEALLMTLAFNKLDSDRRLAQKTK